LAVGNKVSCKTIKRKIDTVKIEFTFHLIQPRKVHIVVDTTYFGKRSQATELDGIIVFKDILTGQTLWAKFVKSETNADYQEGLNYLESKSFEILGVVSDGRRGLARIFSKYPYQVCQFHIQKGVSTLLKMNPKSEAGKDLKQLNNTFIKEKWTYSKFMQEIENYLKIHHQFLNEMSELDSKRYKHERLRKALNKYNLNHKYMFTFQAQETQIRQKLGGIHTTQILTRFNKTRKNKNQIFQNTTNDIDGGLFSPLKNLLGNHRGMNKQSRKRMIILYLNNCGELYPQIDQ
jgi:hypothetical protein